MAQFTDFSRLTIVFRKALNFAFTMHLSQIRKDKNQTPYFAHLMQVCGLVLESCDSEDAAIAALLHDIVEDAGVSIETILDSFGEGVSSVIAELSEDKTLPKAERKALYANNILTMSNSAVLVTLADKLHNMRCIAQGQADELINEVNKEFYSIVATNLGSRIVGTMSDFAHKQHAELVSLVNRVFYK